MTSPAQSHINMIVSVITLIFTRCLMTVGSFIVVILLTMKFGAGSDTDAFFMARLVPITLIAPMTIAFNLALIPTYSSVSASQGQKAATRLAGQFLALTLFGSLVITAAYILFADQIMLLLAPGLEPQPYRDAVWMTRLMAFAIIATNLYAVLDSIQNANRKFIYSAFCAMWLPLGSLTGAAVLTHFWGIRGMAVGIIAGSFMQVICLSPIMFNQLSFSGIHQQWFNNDMIQIVKAFGLIIMVLLTWQITTAVDRMFASLLGEGAVSALSLGAVLIGLIPLLIAFPVYKVMYPQLVELVRQKRNDRLERFFTGNFIIISFITIPVAVTLVLFAGTITQLAFNYGRFSEMAAVHTAVVIRYMSIGVPIAASAIILMYYFLISRQLKLILGVLIATVTVNALLDWILMQLLGLGGIALSSSMIAITRTIVFLLIAEHMIQGRIIVNVIQPVFKILLASLAAGCVMKMTHFAMKSIYAQPTTPAMFGMIIAAVGIGIIVYLAMNLALRNDTLWKCLNMIRKPQPSHTVAIGLTATETGNPSCD